MQTAPVPGKIILTNRILKHRKILLTNLARSVPPVDQDQKWLSAKLSMANYFMTTSSMNLTSSNGNKHFCFRVAQHRWRPNSSWSSRIISAHLPTSCRSAANFQRKFDFKTRTPWSSQNTPAPKKHALARCPTHGSTSNDQPLFQGQR